MKKLVLALLILLLTACQSNSDLKGHYLNGNGDIYGSYDVRIFYYSNKPNHIKIENQNNYAHSPENIPKLWGYYLQGIYEIENISENSDKYTLKLKMIQSDTGKYYKNVEYHFVKKGDKFIDDNNVEFELRKIVDN